MGEELASDAMFSSFSSMSIGNLSSPRNGTFTNSSLHIPRCSTPLFSDAQLDGAAANNRSPHLTPIDYPISDHPTDGRFPMARLPSYESKPLLSRKVFVGGLPVDSTPEDVQRTFAKFGELFVDWPKYPDNHRKRGNRHHRGFVFIIYADDKSVSRMLSACHYQDKHWYILISSATVRNKAAQIRPWFLSDAIYKLNGHAEVDARRTVFIGGLPRSAVARDLAKLFERKFGKVVFASIDVDPDLSYPKGAARVTFATTPAYLCAINGKFVTVHADDIDLKVEIKPYILNDAVCDECEGKRCDSGLKTFFCSDIKCLQYYCDPCWRKVHTALGYLDHSPVMRRSDIGKKQPQMQQHPEGTGWSLEQAISVYTATIPVRRYPTA